MFTSETLCYCAFISCAFSNGFPCTNMYVFENIYFWVISVNTKSNQKCQMKFEGYKFIALKHDKVQIFASDISPNRRYHPFLFFLLSGRTILMSNRFLNSNFSMYFQRRSSGWRMHQILLSIAFRSLWMLSPRSSSL